MDVKTDPTIELGAPPQHRRGRSKIVKFGAHVTLLLAIVFLLHVKAPWNLGLIGRSKTNDRYVFDGCSGPKRSYRRHETFLPINGMFSLYDEIELATTTGSVSVVIVPQPGCGPAILNIHTEVSSIEVNFAMAGTHESNNPQSSLNTPESDAAWGRPIFTTITTRTGSITTFLPAGNGSSTTIDTITGTIKSKFLVRAAGTNDTVSSISTSTNVGNQYISIVPPSICKFSDNCTISNLKASHTMKGAGSMRLSYPPQWEGQIHAQAKGPGTVQVSGKNLKYISEEDREVFAWRGENKHHYKAIEAITEGVGSIIFNADGQALLTDSEM